MTSFTYTLEEHLDIARALGVRESPKPAPTEIWNSPHVEQVKARFKNHKRAEQGERCCYCQRNILGEFSMVLDIEHVLPKSIFNHCIFDLPNLAVSCRKCNMKFKRARVDFLKQDLSRLPKMEKSQLFKKEHYKFAHPNLDSVYDHLRIQSVLDGPETIFRYRILTEVGRYTYEFFQLKEFETESMNRAQGLPPPRSESLHDQIKAIEREIYG
ncbi:HNH endonuclease [Pseudomonas alloputida]|uniref:HNH endonuclease n=1 Tax=Pseudomonas alloputida TaxID=1940621 RepID=A0ABY3CZE5_9PSED|nr:HNH endonuclease [Pseudomonas alloputida]TRZ58741.1 HNH endonuclease [Pseudomonas alloputida]